MEAKRARSRVRGEGDWKLREGRNVKRVRVRARGSQRKREIEKEKEIQREERIRGSVSERSSERKGGRESA